MYVYVRFKNACNDLTDQGEGKPIQRESAEKWLSVQFAFYMLPRQYSPWIYCVTDTFGEQCLAIIQRWSLLRGCFITHVQERVLLFGASLGLEIIIYCGFAVGQFFVASSLYTY